MSKIMELVADYAQECKDFGHLSDSPTLAALQAEVEKLEAEIVRLQHEVVNRNQRALDGDQAKAAFNGMYDKAEALREKLATARNAALEEAAKVCDEHEAYPSLTPRHCADAIRALKEQK